LVFEYFSKVCGENTSFIKIGQEKRVLYVNTHKHFQSHLAHFFLEQEMVRSKAVEKIETHVRFSNFFFLSEIVPFIRCGKTPQSQAGYRWEYGTSALHAEHLRLQTHNQNM